MKFSDYLQNAKIDNSVKHLMTPGLAVEFIQPWYTPLSTTPSSTGIAVGGIGSTFTVTPAGTTPVMNLVPGIQVRSENPADMRLNNFFFREAVVEKDTRLKIFNFASFQQKDAKYTLRNAKGESLFAGLVLKEAEEKLAKIVNDKKFFANNAEAFVRWNTEWSDRTQALLNKGDKSSAQLNRFVLIDFFDGCVGFPISSSSALSAAWGEENEFLGVPGFDPTKMNYRALYPVSETKFTSKNIKIEREQFSYVIPKNERLSSLPVSATEYTLENTSKETREVTIVQMQESLCGYQVRKDRQGVQDSSFVLVPAARNPKAVRFDLKADDGRLVRGVEFYNQERLVESDFDGCMAISAAWNEKDNLNVSVKPMCYIDDEASVLKEALQSGRISKTFVKNVYSGRETIATALVVTAVLKPKAKVSFQFNMVLDFPQIKLNGLESQKKYTTFFPEPFGRVRAILLEALKNDSLFRDSLKVYQDLIPENALKRISTSKGAIDKTRSLALNTLSFLAEATVWDKEDRFLVRECADYPFFNSLDVYFYGSFALLQLMPRLDGAVMQRFAKAILDVDNTRRRHHEYVNHPYADLPDPKLEGPRAVYGAVIHDLGSPFDAKPDAYDWHNVKEWKDLAPKFVLMVLRHYRVSGNISILQECKEAVYACIEYLERMVGEGQTFPLTHGTDDTFDNLSSHGISVYCGSLWIAGLRAAAAIADILGDKDKAVDWIAKSEIAAEDFHNALWDEKEGYFHFFATPLEMQDVDFAHFETLRKKTASTLSLPEDHVLAVSEINHWLNTAEIPEDLDLSRKEYRRYKKEWLTSCCPKAFKDSWKKKLDLDNDDVFADAMLADTYLRLLDLSPITDEDKARRTLKKIFETNYKKNSSLIGCANLVHKDGSPLDEFNFQAHDVWIGIQYSIASAMTLHGMKSEAEDLLDSMVRNLYDEARIPFAAPEGFNGSCKLHSETLQNALNLSSANAKKLHKALLASKAILADSRISPALPRTLAAFNKVYGKVAKANKVEAETLFHLLHSTALKYTAGKYFRPGMIFAVLQAAEKLH